MQTQHSQRVKNLDAFFEKLMADDSIFILEDFVKFFRLLNARLSSYDRPDCALNRGLFLLQILYFLGKDWQVLARVQAVDTV